MKILILMLGLSLYLAAYTKYENDIYIKYTLDGKYNEVLYALVDEISADGFKLVFKAKIGKSLNKLSEHLKEKELFINANKIGFCKKSLALKTMKENIENIVFCPVSLAVYETKKNHIIILYQKARSIKKDETMMLKVNNIMEQLIETSLSK